jgi:hypothetical protein
MALSLSPDEVATITGTTVPAATINVAALLIDMQTGWSVDEHVTARSIDTVLVRLAWATVAVKVHTRNQTVGAEAVTGETQADYSYTESDRFAAASRYGQVCDGTVLELLGLRRASWHHV